MTMTKREKTLVSMLIVLIIICAYWLLFLSPHMKAMAAVKAETAEAETELQNKTEQKIKSDQLLKDLNNKKSQVGELCMGIAQGYDQPAILVYLKKTIEENAVKQTFTFGAKRQIGQMFACPVAVMMQSDYAGLKAVLKVLSGGEYFVKIIGLNVQINNEAAATENATDIEDSTDIEGSNDIEDATPAENDTEVDETLSTSSTQERSEELNVTLNLEFYCTAENVPADTVYTFDSGYQFDSNIFN